MNKGLVVILLVITLFSCKSKELNVKDYLAWVNDADNGLKASKELDNFTFELFYKPVEYIAINEQRKLDVDQQLYQERIKELEGLQYFTLKVGTTTGTPMLKEGVDSEQEYSNRLQYFNDLAENDMSLVEGEDTLSCALFHFERNYGVAPYNSIVLAFPKAGEAVQTKTFVFNEQALEIGKINLKIREQDINNIPKVILN